MPTERKRVSEYEQAVRDVILSSGAHRQVIAEESAWNTLFSSLDLIGDTELAIDAYLSMQDVKDEGTCYLIIYGVLQTMLLQQDAAKAVAHAFGVKVALPSQLIEIRKIRNSAAGHPTRQKENGETTASAITRNSIRWNEFELVTMSAGLLYDKRRRINTEQLVNDQGTYVCEVLSKVTNELHQREQEHRDKFKGVLLVDCLPDTIKCFLSKIAQACAREDLFSSGLSHTRLIEDHVADFRAKLEERDEWKDQGPIRFVYEEVTYPIAELNSYFHPDKNSKLNGKDAYIFEEFVASKVAELKSIAAEIDGKYTSRPA